MVYTNANNYKITSYKNRLLGLCVAIISASNFIAVLSYNPFDQSANTANSGEIHNLLGSFGAITADLIIEYMGIYFLIISSAFMVMGILAIKNGYFPNKLGLRIMAIIGSYFAIIIFQGLYFDHFTSLLGTIIASSIIEIYKHNFSNFQLAINITIFILSIASCMLWLFGAGFSVKKAASILLRIIYLIAYCIFIMMKYFFKTIFALVKLIQFKNDNNASTTTNSSQTSANNKNLHLKTQNKSLLKKTALPGQNVYIPPSPDLIHISAAEQKVIKISKNDLELQAKALTQTLADFGINGEIVQARPGPIVTLYELIPAPGIKASRVISLSDDIARSIGAISARISRVPGKTALGIEIPNEKREIVQFKDLLLENNYINTKAKLPLILGKDISGKAQVTDLSAMPHLLVAGTTGSGKSVALNTMILSLIYKLSPQECRFIMIDPKMLELSIYSDIPHMLTPVVTDPKKAVTALKWAVSEMESRYRLMAHLSTRNIIDYNTKITHAIANNILLHRKVQTGFEPTTGQPIFENKIIPKEKMPYIVVIIDEMADLMMVAGKEVESVVQRLAQMARAAGIHLIMATQRPSVDVITGTIKANFPTRMSFQVSSGDDSRTIIGTVGAEQLLGRGDLLYLGLTSNKAERMHAPKVETTDIERITAYLKNLSLEMPNIEINEINNSKLFDGDNNSNSNVDPLINQAIEIIKRDKKASISYLQRQLKIGYNRSANIIEELEKMSVLSPPNNIGKREILIPTS